MSGVLALDLAPTKNGWCGGDGSSPPRAGCFMLADHGDDYGAFLDDFRGNVASLVVLFEPELIIYESPLLLRYDRLPTLRRTYSLGTHLELFCRDRSLQCVEEDPKNLKSMLTGDAYATKPQMVRAALKLGVDLPPTKDEGKEDAADAVAGWLCGLYEWDAALASTWDARLHSLRGGLL